MKYNIETQLIAQKDHILRLVNNDEFSKAAELLSFIRPLWDEVGYGYKVKEIKERILDTIWSLSFHSEHHKTREKWETLLHQVKETLDQE